MKIKVLGSGCSKCKKLFELTQEAVKQLDLPYRVEYITDVTAIIRLGVMSSPVLTINDLPVAVGYVPDIEKIKELLLGEQSSKPSKLVPQSGKDCKNDSCCKKTHTDKGCCSKTTDTKARCTCKESCK